MKKKPATTHEAPVYDLETFSDKATWTDFYVQHLRDHIDSHPFVGKPHKHDFYLVLYITHGGGTHTIDFTTYPADPGALFLMTPGQVHTWDLAAGTDGYVLFFTREFYEMHLSESSLLDFPFYHALDASPLIQPAQHEAIHFAMQQLYAEYTQAAHPNKRRLRAYLEVLLLEAARYYGGDSAAATPHNTLRLRKLEQLIGQHFRTLKQPSDYAALLHVTPAHLNAICKDNLGKTLTELIQDRSALEAKRLLAYSGLNVNEIAGRLGFADASYFVRWFRKKAGTTPDEFRKL